MMRSLAAMAAGLTAAQVLVAAPSYAGPASSGVGASVERNLGCGMLDAEGQNFGDNTARRTVVTLPDGTASVRCLGQVPDSLAIPDRTVILRGFDCFNNTTNSRAVITPSGRATLICRE